MNTGKHEEGRSTCLLRKGFNGYPATSQCSEFYKHLNNSKKQFEPAVAIFCCSYVLNNKEQVLSRWMEFFEQHLNESSEEEPHTTDTTYADDINSVGRTLEVVCDAYLVLETEAAKVGLKN
jgi:hypothetical protein